MKRIYPYLLAVIIFALPGLCLAGISEDYDQATGKTKIASTFSQIDVFNKIIFFKDRNNSNCTLCFVLKQPKKVLFTSGFVKFTASSFPLNFLKSNFSDTDKEIVTTEAFFDASGPTSRYIITSDSATVTLDTENYGKITWEVPGGILDEWQEVVKR